MKIYSKTIKWQQHYSIRENGYILQNLSLSKYNDVPCAVLCLVTQLCPTLHDPMDSGQPGCSVYGDFPRKNTGVDCHMLLQGIFPTQGPNPGLPHCKQILYCLSHQENPKSGGRAVSSQFWIRDLLPVTWMCWPLQLNRWPFGLVALFIFSIGVEF